MLIVTVQYGYICFLSCWFLYRSKVLVRVRIMVTLSGEFSEDNMLDMGTQTRSIHNNN